LSTSILIYKFPCIRILDSRVIIINQYFLINIQRFLNVILIGTFLLIIYKNKHLIFRDNIEPSVCNLTSHKFVMQTFDVPTVCYHCSKYLKGCIFQVNYYLNLIGFVVCILTIFNFCRGTNAKNVLSVFINHAYQNRGDVV